jgi:hypothetical protein
MFGDDVFHVGQGLIRQESKNGGVVAGLRASDFGDYGAQSALGIKLIPAS